MLVQKHTMGHSQNFKAGLGYKVNIFCQTLFSSRIRRVTNSQFVGSSHSTKRLVGHNDFGLMISLT